MLYLFTVDYSTFDFVESIKVLRQVYGHSLDDSKIKFRYEQDFVRHILGRILLIEGISDLGFRAIKPDDILYSEFHKPFIENGPSFNISHSGSIVICAIESLNKVNVGVDVEEIKPIDINCFNDIFTEKERNQLLCSKSQLLTFYSIWTRKESVLKAYGKGLLFSPNDVDVITEDFAEIDGVRYYIKEINLKQGYACHVATTEKKKSINITDKSLNIMSHISCLIV